MEDGIRSPYDLFKEEEITSVLNKDELYSLSSHSSLESHFRKDEEKYTTPYTTPYVSLPQSP